MQDAGCDIIRLNFSHGEHAGALEALHVPSPTVCVRQERTDVNILQVMLRRWQGSARSARISRQA